MCVCRMWYASTVEWHYNNKINNTKWLWSKRCAIAPPPPEDNNNVPPGFPTHIDGREKKIKTIFCSLQEEEPEISKRIDSIEWYWCHFQESHVPLCYRHSILKNFTHTYLPSYPLLLICYCILSKQITCVYMAYSMDSMQSFVKTKNNEYVFRLGERNWKIEQK